jgi:membrane-associated phospholipid phosphatase
MRRSLQLAAAFVVLSIVVTVGLLRPVDRYAAHHLQPFNVDNLAATMAPSEPPRALRPILRGERSVGITLGAFAFAPADTGSALVLAAGAAVLLRRRGRTWPQALVWVAAVVAALAVEVAGKLVVPQVQFGPPSHALGVTIEGSYPSGHASRAVIVAAMAVVLWRRVYPLAIAWVVFVVGVLELGGLHTPSDIAGGLLLGGALTCAALAFDGQPTRAGDPRPAVQSGGRAPAQAPRPADLQAPPGAADGGRR